MKSILKGDQGPTRDVVLLNAAYRLMATDIATVKERMLLASQAIDSGRALAQLERLREMTNRKPFSTRFLRISY